jgi:hypothetical protein
MHDARLLWNKRLGFEKGKNAVEHKNGKYCEAILLS